MRRFVLFLVLFLAVSQLAGQVSNNITLVNKILPAYGYACDIKVQGNIAYLSGTEHVLMSYNISDPAHPVWLDSYYLDDVTFVDPATAYGNLLVYGNYVYYYVDAETVEVFDVSDDGSISHLITLNSFADLANRYALQGNLLFATEASNLITIWDLQNPLSPVQVGSYTFSHFALDIAVNGNYAYVSHYGGVPVGFMISVLDISNPDSPTLVSSFNGGCDRLLYHNGYLYVNSIASQAIQIIDATDPSNLTWSGQISYPIDFFESDMLVSGDVLVIRSEEPTVEGKIAGAFLRYDLANPASPQALSLQQGDVAYGGCWTVGNNCLFNAVTYYQIEVYGSINTESFAQVGRISGLPVFRSAKQGQNLLLNCGMALNTANPDADPQFYQYCGYLCSYDDFVFTSKASYLYKWAFNGQGTPSLVGSFMVMPVEYNFCAPLNRVGDYIYTTGFFINPDLSGMVQNSVFGYATKILTYANYAYAAGQGVKIYDLSSPTDPQQVGSLFNNSQISDIAIYGSVLIIAKADIGLYLYDLSDPTQPVLIIYKPNALGIEVLEVSGNYLFTSGSHGIVVYSLYNVSQPVQTGWYYDENDYCYDLRIIGSKAYVCQDKCLGIYDISAAVSNPETPELPVEKLQLSCYPNPFSGSTKIEVKGLEASKPFSLKVYNLKGQLVRTLVADSPHSQSELSWNGLDSLGRETAAGLFFLCIEQNGRSAVQKGLRVK